MPQINKEILMESPFPLSEAPIHLPGAQSVKQVRGWMLVGLLKEKYRYSERKRPKNPRAYLEVLPLAGRYHTSVPAYHRFVEELNS